MMSFGISKEMDKLCSMEGEWLFLEELLYFAGSLLEIASRRAEASSALCQSPEKNRWSHRQLWDQTGGLWLVAPNL